MCILNRSASPTAEEKEFLEISKNTSVLLVNRAEARFQLGDVSGAIIDAAASTFIDQSYKKPHSNLLKHVTVGTKAAKALGAQQILYCQPWAIANLFGYKLLSRQLSFASGRRFAAPRYFGVLCSATQRPLFQIYGGKSLNLFRPCIT